MSFDWLRAMVVRALSGIRPDPECSKCHGKGWYWACDWGGDYTNGCDCWRGSL